jgi:tetratricopeptide (TPR) repeat protein
MSERLRGLWNFDDLDATEKRLRFALAGERTDEGRAEVLTQLARVAGLRAAFPEGDRLLDDAESLGGSSRSVQARTLLERGRLRRSTGDAEAALPLFESAFATAVDAGLWFLAADAAHMAALASQEDGRFESWTCRGLDLADEHADAAYWAGPLLNNLGWRLDRAGRAEAALDAFVRALSARERDPGNPGAIAIARYAVGRALRRVGRAPEALPLLEQAVGWAVVQGEPDGWFHEELAEDYAAVGRIAEAGEQAALAIPLLESEDASFAADVERSARLRGLAAQKT